MAEKNCLECCTGLIPKPFQHALKRCSPCADKVWKIQRRATAKAWNKINKTKAFTVCKKCKIQFDHKKTSTIYCDLCRPLAHKESDKQYRLDNVEYYKSLRKKLYKANYVPVPPRTIKCSWCGVDFIAKFKKSFCNKVCKRQADYAYRNARPELSQRGHAIRRTRKSENGGTFTTKEWKFLCVSLGNKCFDCKKSDVKLTIGHVIPVSLGGTLYIDNIIPQCMSCNLKQHDSTHTLFQEPEDAIGLMFGIPLNP